MPQGMHGGPHNSNIPGSGGPNRRMNANKSNKADIIGPKIGKSTFTNLNLRKSFKL